MRTISKLLLIGFGLAVFFSCASSKQKIFAGPGYDPSTEGAPVIIKKVTPEYPPEARAQGDTATVWLKVLVDTLGNVSHPMVVNESGDNIRVFEQAAKDAALKTKWKPAVEDGKPIAVWVTNKVDFNFK